VKCFSPTITQNDICSVSELLRSGDIGFGEKVQLFETKYAKLSQKKFNIGLNSASSAAFCLFAYLYDKYGSCDVYTPAVGFVSPAWAAKKNGHTIHFVDVDENLLFDFDSYRSIRKLHLERQLNATFNKSIIMPVLYGGVSDISGLIENIKKTNWGDITIVDSAHCIAPTIEADYTFFSFHPVKPVAMSNGGLLATDNKEANDYIRRYRNFGREDNGDSYDIVDNGFNFYMNNLNAALGLSQLSTCFENVKKRKEHFEYLKRHINPSVGYFTNHDVNSSYYLATLILNKSSSGELRKKMRKNNLCGSYHYPFLHQTKLFYAPSNLPQTEVFRDRIINLPIHQNLKKENLDDIIKIINQPGR